jgi:hypothetical protein
MSEWSWNQTEKQNKRKMRERGERREEKKEKREIEEEKETYIPARALTLATQVVVFLLIHHSHYPLLPPHNMR